MTLEELFDIHCESLSTKRNIQWQRNGRFELGSFDAVDRNFTIQIENKPIIHFDIPVLKGKKTAEVSFFQADPLTGKETFDATGEFSGSKAIQILGIVTNALLLKFKEYDAFYFVVKPEHTGMRQKTAVFYHIASRLAKSQGFHPYERTVEGAPAFLTSKIPIDNLPDDWSNPVKEMLESINWSTVPKL